MTTPRHDGSACILVLIPAVTLRARICYFVQMDL